MTNDKFIPHHVLRTINWKIVTITLLAFWVRVQNLTYHSIWFDEAISLRWAQSTVARILEVSMHLVEDRLPPLYYLLLKWWVDGAGVSEFSVRYLSVLFGVLLIPVLYTLGHKLFGQTVGWVAALLAAVNPFLVWYSQEARMYALAVLLGTLGVLFFVDAISPPQPLPRHKLIFYWAGMGVCVLAGLYTHLYTGFLWPALALWLLANPRTLKRVWLPFGLTMGTAATLFLPLAIANWRFSGESVPGNPWVGVGARILELFRAFVVWRASLATGTAQVVLAVLALFLLAGIALALQKQKGWLVIGLLAMPFVVASILLLRSRLAFFGERYFIVLVPWLLLLQALGVGWFFQRLGQRSAIRQSAGWSAVLLLVGVTAVPLPGLWSVPAAKETWRQTVAYMTTHVQPGDAVFIHPEWVRFPYQYYARQMGTPGQTYAAFFAVDENTDLDGPLNGILDDHPVVWLIESHLDEPDPERRVENWFAARYPLVTELYPPGVVLKAYAPGYQLNQLPATATPTDAVFASGIRLRGFRVFDPRLPARETLFHPPSNWIHVALYWSPANGSGAEDVFPYVHLVDKAGQVWGASLERGSDAFHFYPPSRWQSGQIIRLDVDVNLNPVTPSGEYRLVVGVGEESTVLSVVEIED